jgi:O-antigen ligase
VTVIDTVSTRARAVARADVHPGVLILAAAIPILFLHIKYQPGVRVPLGSTHLGLELSDAGVVAVGIAALVEGRRRGFAPLRPALPLWIAAAALLVWILARSESLKHAVTAVKFAEYALLAVSCPLLLRRRADWELVAAAVAAWSAIATLVGLMQFFGVDIAGAWPAGRRQPSFLGHSDFAALSAFALGIGLAALVFGRRRLGWLPVSTGALGLILAAASAGLAGVVLGTLAFLFAAVRRRTLRPSDLLATLAVVGVVSVGVLSLRAGDFDQFFRFIHVKRQEHSTSANVQTYAHHTLLAYVGYRIWRDHPLAGAGWQASNDPANVDPVLPAAHRRFPDEPPIAFPTPAHEYGVQNAYVQAAADLGAIGLVLWFLPFAAALALALRANAPPGALAGFVILAVMGLWGAQGLVAGLPLDALTWLGFGLAATAAAAPARAGLTDPSIDLSPGDHVTVQP